MQNYKNSRGPALRVMRNVCFWLLFTIYLYSGKERSAQQYIALLCTLLVSYGIPCYVNNLVLIPRYLVKRKFLKYLSFFVPLLVLTTVGSFYSTALLNHLFPDINYMGTLKNVQLFYHVFPSTFVFVLLASGKFAMDAIHNQHRMENLEKERMRSELDSLRSQINPHFLFNALNTIYGMARRTDHETSEAVLKLADILRHNLYDGLEGTISMSKEIDFLKQYIDFAQLRIHDRERIKIHFDVEITGQHIAPLLLVPFVENAIKHGLGNHASKGWVKIALYLRDNKLHFVCSNSNYNKAALTSKLSGGQGGIGTRNTARRLDLLYPGKLHSLIIEENAEYYKTELNLQLS